MSELPSRQLRIRREAGPPAVILEPEGDVDTQSYDLFRAALAEATAAGCPNVVVDLAKVQYIDTVGLGALVSGLRDAQEAGCRLSLVSMNPHLFRVLDVSGLLAIFPVYHNRDEAVEDAELSADRPDR